MFDIHFYMKAHELKKQLMSGEKLPRTQVMETLEKCRSKTPLIYNIETTNACNMRCKMCPRTTMMTRPIETMDMDSFKRIADQLSPFSNAELMEWMNFVELHYGINRNDMSENHYFLYVIPKVLVLHGYGDPLLDKHMPERVAYLTKRNILSYFSCNPANIKIDKMHEMMANGLGYVKYSIESVDDSSHKEIRGNASNFTESYQKILELLRIKKQHGYGTTIVITMLDLGSSKQDDEFRNLMDKFRELDVYIYLKSQDQKWYKDAVNQPTKSIHWQEFCQFPFSSMTIKSNGESVMCVEDYNNEIVLGNTRTESLEEIWNGEPYRKLRQNHFDLTKGIKCTERCDMSLAGSFEMA